MITATVFVVLVHRVFGHGTVTKPVPRKLITQPWCPWCVGEHNSDNPYGMAHLTAVPTTPCLGTSRDDARYSPDVFGSFPADEGPSEYVAGTSFDTIVGINADHGGKAQWSFCPHSEPESEACFNNNPLTEYTDIQSYWGESSTVDHLMDNSHFPQRITLPNMNPGRITLRWLWKCKFTDEIFASCIDVNVVTRTAPPTPNPAPSPSPLPPSPPPSPGPPTLPPPSPPTPPRAAYATRYWDCCKPHCSWKENTFGKVSPLATCSKNDVKQSDANLVSACSSQNVNSAFTCFDNTPWAANSSVAFGFAAVPAKGDVCGKCYKLNFTGGGKYGANEGAAKLANKVMIVQATNVGYDVHNQQFDVMIPGGGVGLFDACSYQWGVSTPGDLGEQYGGFLSACQRQHGHNKPLLTYKTCVRDKCDAIFGGNEKFRQLHAGCRFFIDWYEVADNPTLTYSEVACPRELIKISSMDRGDTVPTPSPGPAPNPNPSPGPTPSPGDCSQYSGNCDCTWANVGTCATNDHTTCNLKCCCPFRQLSPDPEPEPEPGPTPTMVNMGFPKNRRCKGKPLKLNGKRWGNLGQGTEERCKRKCLENTACKYVVYKAHKKRPNKGKCSAFAMCQLPIKARGFTNWKKVFSPGPYRRLRQATSNWYLV